MADLHSIVVGPPYAGLDTASGPGGGGSGTVPYHRNWLPHFPAKAKARGPLGAEVKSEVLFGNTWPKVVYGAIEHDDYLIVGYVKKNANQHNVSPWQAPHVSSLTQEGLMEPDTSLHKINLKTREIEEQFGSQDKCPYLQGERLGRNTFYLSASGKAGPGNEPPPGIELNGHWVFNSEIRYWDGDGSREFDSPAILGAKYLKAHLERLWVFGGSNPQAPHTVTAAEAQSDMGAGGLEVLGLKDRAVWETLEVGSKITASTGTTNLVGMTVEELGIPHISGPTWWYPVRLSGIVSPAEELESFTNVKFENPGWSRGVKQYPNALWFSAQEGPFGVNAWTSPVSGLVNKIVVGNEENDYLVGGAVVNQNLLIFKRHSIWYLTGYSPETFTLRKLTAERGCVDPWSICEANGGVYFASQNGFEFFDGSEFHTIDAQVSNSVRTRMIHLATKGDNTEENVAPTRVQITYFGNGYLLVSLQEFNVATLVSNSSENYLYHIPSGNWTQLTSYATFEDRITFVNYTSGLPWLFDGKYFRNCEYLTNPDAEPNQKYYELDPENEYAKTPIPAEYETDRIDLSGNGGYTSQLHRFMLDYLANRATGDDDAAEEGQAPLRVELINDNGAVLNEGGIEYELPAQGHPAQTKFIEGRRFEEDTFTEAVSGMKMRVQTIESPNEGTLTEIYDSIFELQTARQRRRV